MPIPTHELSTDGKTPRIKRHIIKAKVKAMPKLALNVDEVAELTGTPRATLYKWAKLPLHPFPKPIKISNGRKGLRWSYRKIERYLDGLEAAKERETARIREALRFGRKSA